MTPERLMAEYIVDLGRVDYFLCDEMHTDFSNENCGADPDRENCIRCVMQHFAERASKEDNDD